MQTFYTEIIFTSENLKDEIEKIAFVDMSQEIAGAIQSESENSITYQSSEKYSLCFFPNAKRGGIVTNGETDWTDCDSVEDLQERWDDYHQKWSN